MSKTALVAGATGLVGRALLNKLLDDGAYATVKVIGRTLPAARPPKLHFILSDFSDLEKLGAQLAADDVFCCLGTTLRRAGSKPAFERVDYHMVVELARAAKKAGAKKFLVISAAGSSLRSPSFYSRVKARMEQAVGDAGLETVHLLRPSLLLGDRAEFRPGEWLAQLLSPLLSRLLDGPLKKYRPISAEAVAEAMLQLARREERGVKIHHLPLD